MELESKLKKNQPIKTAVEIASGSLATIKTLTFISPCYNEEKNLQVLYLKLKEVSEQLKNKYAIETKTVLVDDGSTDDTWSMISRLSKEDKNVVGVKLSRNFGKENALFAGYEQAPESDFYATLDADLQDDPDIIDKMIQKSLQGFDIVYAQRASRKDSLSYVVFTKIFYWFMRLGSKVDFPPNVSDFHVVTHRVKQAFLSMQESVRYSRGLIFYTGYKKASVLYDRPQRSAGVSSFNLLKLTGLVFDAWTSFSSLPVHLVSISGLVLSILSFLIGAVYVLISILNGQVIPGWASIISITLFLGSTQILMVGVIAEYIARMNNELKKRPKYFLDEKLN
jgi:polyisoprenyl-phosphate glycosyltransferase